MRSEFEMTPDELATILDAGKPTICIMVGGYSPPSPQQNANTAWAALGRKRGFRHLTVRPVQGKENRFFTAEATKTYH